MRTTTIVLTLVAVAALVTGGTETSLAGSADRPHPGNSGHVASGRLTQIAPLHKATPNSPDFHRIGRPTTAYTAHTCLTDLSAIGDFTIVDQIDSNCGVTITFDPHVEKRSVPASWRFWESPPRSEGKKPDVLFNAGATTLTISYDAPQTIGGFEAEPDQFQRENIEADFYSGRNGTGEHVGTIFRRRTSSPRGARLFAVRSTTAWQSIVVTDLAGDDFAVARLRTSP